MTLVRDCSMSWLMFFPRFSSVAANNASNPLTCDFTDATLGNKRVTHKFTKDERTSYLGANLVNLW